MTASFLEQMRTIYTYLGMLSIEIPSPPVGEGGEDAKASEPDEG
jgi:hypothetical protein